MSLPLDFCRNCHLNCSGLGRVGRGLIGFFLFLSFFVCFDSTFEKGTLIDLKVGGGVVFQN